MFRNRTTLREEITFEGKGIHSGRLSSIRISPHKEGQGITFAFGERRYSIAEASSDGSKRSTSLIFPGGERVRTVEHILSAIVGSGLDDVLITAYGEETPIMDGSPLPFAEAIISRGLSEFDSEYVPRTLDVPICVDWGESSIVALPSNEIRITYVIDYPDSPIGTEMKSIVVTEENYMSEIAPARTFCLAREAVELRKAGFGLGGGEDNVLIIGEDGPRAGYRVNCECAAHKAADLLGDLTLAGFVPHAHYICVRGGHALHLRLADRVKRNVL
ncbi:MAG: UDP-3-O-acyl-N-acetylglucosamine deacetylase [Synergistaceae bacterium]|nr:UDP-3-O-acyl-N-acetylglucosamine deacetylase [Synergistaceae bacterium]